MESCHRTLLRRNRMAFAEDLVLEEVTQILVEENILNDRMVEVISSKVSTFDRNVAFLNKLPTRGPSAFHLFHEALLKTGQDHLADILRPALPPGERDGTFLGNIGRLQSSPSCLPSSFSFTESTPSKTSDGSFNTSFDVNSAGTQTPNLRNPQPITPKVMQSTPDTNIVNLSPLSAKVPSEANVARTPVEQMDITVQHSHSEGRSTTQNIVTNFEALRSNSSLEALQSAARLHPSNITANNFIEAVTNDNHTFQNLPSNHLNMDNLPPTVACDAPTWENVEVKPATIQFLQEHLQYCYPQFNDPKGVAIIINVTKFEPSACLDDRLGGDIDCARLELMFLQLCCDVYKVINRTASEISNTLKNFAVWAKLKEYESCFVVLMSHGEDGVIFGTDGQRISLNNVFNLFSNENCPHLQNKPKVFLIQACRGDQPDKGVDQLDAPSPSLGHPRGRKRRHLNFDEPDTRRKLPTSCDCLYAYATVPGYTAMRNTEKGSWFIQAFIQVVAFHARNRSLMEIMTMVNNKVKEREGWSPNTEFHRCKEMSEFTSTLSKPFYFFPGIYFKRKSDT